jgi:hypothetical protein
MQPRRTLFLSCLAATAVSVCAAQPAGGAALASRESASGLAAQPVNPTVGAAWGAPRDAARIFVSGHSLTDNPLPAYLAAVADSLGTSAKWNRQYIVGSAIRTRTRGLAPGETGWPGYRHGYNREGEGLDVIAELREPRTLGGDRYDTLLITEQNVLLGTLVWNDTVRYLRHFHDRFIDGNPAGQTYFYESWLAIDDKADPRRWIAYERAASPVWQCIATRINMSLAAEGRSDRIVSLPAGAALAELIERATQGSGLPGVTANSTRETIDRVVSDDVHLTRLGVYYVSLISYASIYRRSPLGAWMPPEVTHTQAAAMQQLAWEFVSRYYAAYAPLDVEQCRALLTRSFIGTYWTYVRDSTWRKQLNPLHAYARWIRHFALWQLRFQRDDDENPFHYDPATDRGYWYPAP